MQKLAIAILRHDYRQALTVEPENSSLMKALAGTLESTGDGQKASSCYMQLARGNQQRGSVDEAVIAARRAADLSPENVEAKRLLLDCLEWAGHESEWLEEAVALAERLSFDGYWDEARELCEHIVQQNPQDPVAYHILANACNHIEDQDLQDSDVRCVQCGAINQRSHNACVECRAPLHLVCRTCGREVAFQIAYVFIVVLTRMRLLILFRKTMRTLKELTRLFSRRFARRQTIVSNVNSKKRWLFAKMWPSITPIIR